MKPPVNPADATTLGNLTALGCLYAEIPASTPEATALAAVARRYIEAARNRLADLCAHQLEVAGIDELCFVLDTPGLCGVTLTFTRDTTDTGKVSWEVALEGASQLTGRPVNVGLALETIREIQRAELHASWTADTDVGELAKRNRALYARATLDGLLTLVTPAGLRCAHCPSEFARAPRATDPRLVAEAAKAGWIVTPAGQPCCGCREPHEAGFALRAADLSPPPQASTPARIIH